MSTSITNIDVLTADRTSAIGSIGDIRNYVRRATVKGRLMQSETLTVELVAGANTFDAIKELDYGLVLDISSWTNQYFISKVRRNYPDQGGATIEAKAFWERLKFSRAKRTYSGTKKVDRVYSIYKRTPANALSDIMTSAPSGFAAGSVSGLTADQEAVLVTLSLEDDTHWRAIEKLCEAIANESGETCEFYFSRSGDTYSVNLVQQVGLSGNRSVKAGGGDASSPSNRIALDRTTHGDEYFSRLSAVIGDEAENITLGRDHDGEPIKWDVESIVLNGDGTSTLTLAGEPVPFDDWGVGSADEAAHFFGNESEGFFRITDSTYPNTVVIRTGTTAMTFGFFAEDVTGAALDYIRTEGAEPDFGIVEKSTQVQGSPMPNLIRRAGDSDDMTTFVAGVPDGWTAVGAPTVAQVTDERYAQVGTYAAQVQAGIGEGLRTSFYEVRGGLASCLARIAVEAGEVQVRMVDADDNRFPGPDEGQAISNSRSLQALALGVWNTFTNTVAVEILATKPDTVFYLDAVTLTPSNGSYDWEPVMGGRELWAEAGRILARDGGSVYSELSGSSIDLTEVTGIAGFAAFELGALVTIQDGYQGGVHDVNLSTRVIEFEKSIIGSAYEARWTAERVREDAIDYLRAGKPVRPRPLPQSPITPRYAPRLAVEREDVADAGGGEPGVRFTLFPKTAKNEDLENWRIFVSVDAAVFSEIANDEAGLTLDVDTGSFVGGGFVGTLGTVATTTYSVTYPPDDGSVKQVRFYVEARSTGLTSAPVEFLVRNPELAATQVTGALIAEQLVESAQSYGKTFTFAATDADTVAWGAGTLTFADGTGYSINAGNTGNMTPGVVYFIYFDPEVSTTVLQVTTTNATAVGDRKKLLAIARPSLISAGAFFVDAVGVLQLSNEQLAVDSVDTNQLRANSITGVKIAAASIEALHIGAGQIDVTKLSFTPITTTDTLDLLPDGATYGRVLKADLSAGHVLMSAVSGTLDNIADGTTYAKLLATSISAGKALLSQVTGNLDDVTDGTTYERVLATDVSAGHILLTETIGTLDSIDDGATYERVLATDITAGHILLAQATGTLDDVDNGATYGRILVADLSAGHLVLSTAIGDLGDIDGDLDDISDGALFEKVNAAAVTAGNILLSQATGSLDNIADGGSYERVLGTDVSAGHILMTAVVGDLDDIADGTYGKVLATKITAGSILLAETTGTLDDVDEGSTYGKIKQTILAAGFIQVGTGTKDSTLSGWNIQSTEIVGQASGVDQVVLGTNGKITAGAGNVVLDVSGITATAGTIGGWTLGATTLTGGNATLSSSGVLTLGTGTDVAIMSAADGVYRFWVGHTTPTSAPLRIGKAGNLIATSAQIVGNITAESGSLVDLDIDGTLTIGASGSIVAGGTTIDDDGISLSEYSGQTSRAINFLGGTNGATIYGSGGDLTLTCSDSLATLTIRSTNGSLSFIGPGGISFATAPDVSGNTVWHAGNDGSGSGLDADLLDGSEGSAYAKKASAQTITGAWTFDKEILLTSIAAPGTTSNRVYNEGGAIKWAGSRIMLGPLLTTELLKINTGIASNAATNMPQYTKTITIEDAAANTIKLYGT